MPKARNAANIEARECIATALIKLTKTQPLSTISITELCRVAGVSRMAFYRNYESKEQVLIDQLDAVVDKYTESTRAFLKAGELWWGAGHMTLCFTYLRDNLDLVESLGASGLDTHLLRRIAAFIIDTWGDGTPQMEYELASFAGTLGMAFDTWMRNGFDVTPLQVAEYVRRPYVERERLSTARTPV